ncbi:MAG: HD domain-containing protein [Gammaproteobacteria bacterium]|nr:HD domain-containing protein [Gammaproteobacteria bacterium]
MSELVKQAREFATAAHQRIDHRRKYTKQPYQVHLKSVAHIVASVTDDEEMIAAAWLHDTVEDTAATHYDIEQQFGKEVHDLVYALTDISKPGDGNRAARKAIDRSHLARASVRAKSVKLADLIDNLRDICKHDEKFARVYLHEMSALLEVLGEGDEALLRRAGKELCRCSGKLGLDHPPGSMLVDEERAVPWHGGFSPRRVQRIFKEVFTARDVGELLRSFDAERLSSEVRDVMQEQSVAVAGVRKGGQVTGYVRIDDLTSGTCGQRARSFSHDQMVYDDTSLMDVILILTRHDYCFLALLDEVVGVITRADMEKPIVRMWLFGMITIIEMEFAASIHIKWPNESWRDLCSAGRLRRAEALCEERLRISQQSDLLDCLQLGDKARVLFTDAEILKQIGFNSRSEADKAIKSIESLRNNLAHGQSIVAYDWPSIVTLSQGVQRMMASI